MKIRDILKWGKPLLSFEVFPPKSHDDFETVRDATRGVASLNPPFMSVTCGAGNGNNLTAAIAADIQETYRVPVIAHLTCVNTKKEEVRNALSHLKELGIENILALRGDLPHGITPEGLDFHHASELVREIRAFGDFSIGCAAYPEGHPESPTQREDIRYLAEKVKAGCDFMTTQMFFDNNVFYNFLYKVREADIRVPVIPGIMPVTNGKQIARICALSGTVLPPRFRRIVDRFGDHPAAMKQAGIAYATEQVVDLFSNGIHAVHIYSMNKPDVAAAIMRNLSEIIK